MKYQAPYGSPDPDAPYVDRDTPGATSGSKVPAKAVEHMQREIANGISYSGFTPSEADLQQLAKAMRAMALNCRVAGGTASALTLPLDPAPAADADLNVLFVRLASNISGATTINYGLGAKDVVRADGTPLKKDDGVAGQVLMLLRNGSAWQVAGLSTSLLPTSNIQRYTVPGTYSWPVPAGRTKVRVGVKGGGGGGGGASAAGGSGGGGGGAGYSWGEVAVTPGASITVIVGAGGTAGIGAGSVNGGAGGTSSFGSGSPISATGGGGGVTQAGSGGAGGNGSGGQINEAGGNGYGGVYLNGTTTPVGGNGAPCHGGSVIPAYVSGASVQGFGAGVGGSGSGWNGAPSNGSMGAPGEVEIWY